MAKTCPVMSLLAGDAKLKDSRVKIRGLAPTVAGSALKDGSAAVQSGYLQYFRRDVFRLMGHVLVSATAVLISTSWVTTAP